VKDKASPRILDFYIEDRRAQRFGLLLRDVAYVIHGYFDVLPGAIEERRKYEEMFERRASKGQCFMQPYLGCREFSSYFELIDADAGSFETIPKNEDLGWMLYDMDYNGDEISPKFFRAIVQNGVIQVPPIHSPEVRG